MCGSVVCDPGPPGWVRKLGVNMGGVFEEQAFRCVVVTATSWAAVSVMRAGSTGPTHHVIAMGGSVVLGVGFEVAIELFELLVGHVADMA